MLKLLYTNSPTPFGDQTIADFSVGGFISRSEVPNDTLSNLFSELSILQKQNNKREAYLLALKNEFASDVALRFVFEKSDNSICKFYVGIVTPSQDHCNNLYFEKLKNSDSKPVYVDLEEILSPSEIADNSQVDNTLIVPVFQPGSYIGIWFVRETDKEKTKQLTCQQVIDLTVQDRDNTREESLIMNIEITVLDQSNSNSSSNSSS